jgi:hypothetical protein
MASNASPTSAFSNCVRRVLLGRSKLRLLISLGFALLPASVASLQAAETLGSSAPSAIRALSPDHMVFDETPGMPSPLNSPTILRLDGGRLVAASERGGISGHEPGKPRARICTSDDGVLTWTPRATVDINRARLFQAGNAIYYFGYHKDLKIMRSDDRGEHWSEPADLRTQKGQ